MKLVYGRTPREASGVSTNQHGVFWWHHLKSGNPQIARNTRVCACLCPNRFQFVAICGKKILKKNRTVVLLPSMAPRINKMTRASKVTEQQLSCLVDYMESHSHFANGRFLGKNGKSTLANMWNTLSVSLNAVPQGAQKTPKQWQTVWRDLKFKVSQKMSTIRKERTATGNRPTSFPPMTPLEQRITSITGREYMEGTDCLDSIAEEEQPDMNDIYSEMEVVLDQADDTTFQQVFVVDLDRNRTDEVTFREENEMAASDHNRTEERQRNEMAVSFSDQNRTEENMSQIDTQTDSQIGDMAAAGPSTINNISMEHITAAGPSRQAERSCRRNLSPRTRPNSQRERIGVQLMTARQQFAALQENNVEAVQNLGEAIKMQAEAAKERAAAERERNELKKQMVAIAQSKAAALMTMATCLQQKNENEKKIIELLQGIEKSLNK